MQPRRSPSGTPDLDRIPPLIGAGLAPVAAATGKADRMRSKTFDRRDLHRTVTETIVAQLEAGTAPWARPWSAGPLAGPISRPLRVSGQPYRGINVLMLWLAAAAKGYASPTWMTFKQALELGGCVRRGEKASPVTFADKRR